LLRGHDRREGVAYMGAYKTQPDQLVEFITRHATGSSLFVESDFSSNDMTQLRDVHVLEVKWLTRLGAPQWLTGMMLHANSFSVTSRKFGVMARVVNQLPTGAQSTTFRNSMWNMTINYAFCKRNKFFGDSLVLGDDMLMRLDNPWSACRRSIRRSYEYVCKLAGMVAEVSVSGHLSECSFLSKHFIMTDRGYVLVPKLGKAIARFNARASANEAVSDRSYLCGKALSYAYEFRFVPVISRCFLTRFSQLFETQEQVSLDGLGWNVKGAFLDLGVRGILESLDSLDHVASRADMTRFYHWKYGFTASDVLDLLLATLFQEEDLDVVSVGRIIEDWV